MPELKPEDHAVAEFREFVKQIANGLFQFELIRGRCFQRTLFPANSRHANDPRARLEQELTRCNAQVFDAPELAPPYNPQ